MLPESLLRDATGAGYIYRLSLAFLWAFHIAIEWKLKQDHREHIELFLLLASTSTTNSRDRNIVGIFFQFFSKEECFSWSSVEDRVLTPKIRFCTRFFNEYFPFNHHSRSSNSFGTSLASSGYIFGVSQQQMSFSGLDSCPIAYSTYYSFRCLFCKSAFKFFSTINMTKFLANSFSLNP
jgi:hypothetical protein